MSPGGEALSDLHVHRAWSGPYCKLSLDNRSTKSVSVGEVTAFDLRHGLPPDTPLYAEGFQMLSQTGGTLGNPEALGGYTDAKHYRLPTPEGAFTAYNLILLGPMLAAFSSCRRFTGKFHLRPQTLEVALDLEGLEIAPGQTMELEELTVYEGEFAGPMLNNLAVRIAAHHPPIHADRPPQGWCSWYCFGPRVTAEQVVENLEFIAKNMPALRYIQIDDGYQPAMGDWLETGQAFGGNVQNVLKQIRQRGFEPAIWVAPFVAEAGSKLFREHPDRFMKDNAGAPLASDKVTFGGWRHGPWYALDGTHPDAQAHLEKVFATMRKEWGVTYFKLDANFWGAMPGGRLHDASATRVEAYRRGMEAVRRGAGDAFILGCNHPLWPSLGLIHGSRSSGDINRKWTTIKKTARENLRRGWQNSRLWWNDPDVVLLNGDLTEDEFHFHAAVIYACGGLLLSGDDLPRLPPARLAMLRKVSPPAARAATFDRDLRIGFTSETTRTVLFFLNWNDQPEDFQNRVPPDAIVKDFWTGETVKTPGNMLRVTGMPAHSARMFVVT